MFIDHVNVVGSKGKSKIGYKRVNKWCIVMLLVFSELDFAFISVP